MWGWRRNIIQSRLKFGIFGLKGWNSQNKQNACISAIWPWNENLRAFSFLQLLNLKKTKCPKIFIWRPYGLVMAYLIKVNAYCFKWIVTKISKYKCLHWGHLLNMLQPTIQPFVTEIIIYQLKCQYFNNYNMKTL